MNKKANIFKTAFSYLLDIPIFNTQSTLNNELNIVLRNGRRMLNAKHANYSFGGLHKVFQMAFDKSKIENLNITDALILGFGAGSIAKILRKERNEQFVITGVELDPKIIELYQEYFKNIDDSKLQILNMNAIEFAENCNRKFQLICIDIFIDLYVPADIQSEKFIISVKKMCDKNATVFYNFIVNSKTTNQEFKNILKHFSAHFTEIDVLHLLDFNRVIVAKN